MNSIVDQFSQVFLLSDKQCDTLVDPVHGEVHQTGRYLGDRAIYTCIPGKVQSHQFHLSLTLGLGCSAAVEHSSHDREVGGLIPPGAGHCCLQNPLTKWMKYFSKLGIRTQILRTTPKSMTV